MVGRLRIGQREAGNGDYFVVMDVSVTFLVVVVTAIGDMVVSLVLVRSPDSDDSEATARWIG